MTKDENGTLSNLFGSIWPNPKPTSFEFQLSRLNQNPWAVAANGSLRNAMLGAVPAPPKAPSAWTSTYLTKLKERHQRRVDGLEGRIQAVTLGRIMPDAEQVTIGSGKHFPSLAVMFLDICGFSAWGNWSVSEQLNVLKVMNIFMAGMMEVIRDFGGTLEKNTGDGLMAYFGDASSETNESRARLAVDVASIMSYLNDNIYSPWCQEQGYPSITFRVGIDVGPVTIARVGIPNQSDQMVAIGTTANVACKLMRLVDQGGICIGNYAYEYLEEELRSMCSPAGNSVFEYRETHVPYPGWKFNRILKSPDLWGLRSLLG